VRTDCNADGTGGAHQEVDNVKLARQHHPQDEERYR
jgi:hypothetical protein